MRLRVVLHAPTPGALRRALSNAANLRAAEPEAEIEIVANADAAAAALGSGADVTLCANSLRARGLVAPAGARVVAAAVVHLARRQAEGWAYLRA